MIAEKNGIFTAYSYKYFCLITIYKVKGEAWDKQWKNKAYFFSWLNRILAEYHRVLKPAGSLYLFAGPHLATQVEMVVLQHFNLLNHIIWRKPTGKHLGCRKESLRKFFPQTRTYPLCRK